jgi:predicted O-methyltransferase YrrM
MHTWSHLYGPVREGLSQHLSPATRVYLELGSWCGGSALLAAELAPHAQLICIDAWDGRGGAQYDPAIAARSLELFQANLWEHRSRVLAIQSDTLVGMTEVHIAGIRPDVVYVDADHHLLEAATDIRLALSLFPQAVICGDDYNEPCGRAADVIAGHAVQNIGRKFWWIER